MLEQFYTKQFKKDLAKVIKRGKQINKLEELITILVNEEKVPAKYKDHALIVNYKDRRDCHIEPDWLLIYMKKDKQIFFERTGTHADLFKK